MRPSVLLWDFGDTLVDERWMRRGPDACPEWEPAWSEVMAHLADDWNVGAVSMGDVFGALAESTGMTTHAVERHARDCCERLLYNPTAWQVARERRLPQALVTVNPDLFVDYIVPTHDLAAVFDVIVTSAGERTADKVELCSTALQRLDFDGDQSQALLIDNRHYLVEAWRTVGGAGYWFQTDEGFARDLSTLIGEPRIF